MDHTRNADTPSDEYLSDEEYLSKRREHLLSPLQTKAGSIASAQHDECWSRAEAFQFLDHIGAVLYAVQYGDGVVKIGSTSRLGHRLSTLSRDGVRTGHGPNPQLVAFKFGTRADELAIHRQLSAHVAHGREWYHPTPEVMALVNSWREALGRESLAA